MTCEPTATPDAVWRSYGVSRRSTRTVRVRISAALVAATVLAVLLVPPLVQLDQQAVDLSSKLLSPSWSHPFGTDDLGRDLFLRCVHGLRVSLLVGAAAALVGWADRALMRLVDTFSSVPRADCARSRPPAAPSTRTAECSLPRTASRTELGRDG